MPSSASSPAPLSLLLACQAVAAAAFALPPPSTSTSKPSTSTTSKSKPPTQKSLITKRAFSKTKTQTQTQTQTQPQPQRKKAADLPLPFPRHPSRPSASAASESVAVAAAAASQLLPDEDEYSEYNETRRTQRRAARTDKFGAPFYQRWTPPSSGPGGAADLPTEHRREVRVHFADFPGFSQFWSFADLRRHSVHPVSEWPLCTRYGAELVFYYRRARFTPTQRKGEAHHARWGPDSDPAGYRAFMAERPYRRF